MSDILVCNVFKIFLKNYSHCFVKTNRVSELLFNRLVLIMFVIKKPLTFFRLVKESSKLFV
jgi:hypothetical protein